MEQVRYVYIIDVYVSEQIISVSLKIDLFVIPGC